MATEYRIRKSNIRDLQAVPVAEPAPPANGKVVLAIDRFALTANNVTYAATGEVLRYWQFFALQDAAFGLVPVWGFATVLASACDGIAVGERLFGFFPMASHVTLAPGNITDQSLMDMADHRRELPVIYNQYRRLAPDADRSMDDYLALLYPLFATSYLLNDFFVDNNWFEAQQLVVASASSKTAIGLLQLANKEPSHPHIVGLTSAGNREFVQNLGCCGQVVTYDEIATKLRAVPTVFVDIAGNMDVREQIHNHLGDALVHSCAVGTSHWDKFREAGPMPGAKPKFFFAPAQSEKRRAQWGAQVLAAKITQAWAELSRASNQWMRIERGAGERDVAAVWAALADGRATPDVAHMLSP